MVLSIRVNGRKTSSMVKDMKNGLTALHFWVNMHMVKKMDMVYINGLMAQITKVNGKKTKLMELESIHG